MRTIKGQKRRRREDRKLITEISGGDLSQWARDRLTFLLECFDSSTGPLSKKMRAEIKALPGR